MKGRRGPVGRRETLRRSARERLCGLGRRTKSVLQGLLVIQTACIGNTAGQRAWRHWQHGSKLGHHSSRAASRHRIELLGNWGAMRRIGGKHRKHRKHSNQINCPSYLAANTRDLLPALWHARRGCGLGCVAAVCGSQWHQWWHQWNRWHQRHRGWASGWLGVLLF